MQFSYPKQILQPSIYDLQLTSLPSSSVVGTLVRMESWWSDTVWTLQRQHSLFQTVELIEAAPGTTLDQANEDMTHGLDVQALE